MTLIYFVEVTDGYETVATPYIGLDFLKARNEGEDAAFRYIESENEIWENDPYRPEEHYKVFISVYEDGANEEKEVYRYDRNKDEWVSA